ncbi:unnamed protein product [Sphagnum balticum]
MVFGSHLYGTNTPQSDFDYKRVFIPTAKDILLGSVQHSVVDRRDKGEGEKNYAGEHEEEAFSLQRYLRLLADGQTGPLDMIFAPDWAITDNSDLWKCIVKNRAKFLTRKTSVFCGYCAAQANKYGIKGSRVAAARAALSVLDAGMATYGKGPLGLMHAELSTLTKATEHIEILPIQQKDGSMLDHISVCGRKFSFTAPMKMARDTVALIIEQYGKRALMAETQQGVDWKAMSHAVRFGHEALELLATGHITFPLPNAEHVKRVKRGEFAYQQVAEEIENLMERVAEVSASSSLPDEPDHAFIEELVLDAHRKQVIRDTN